MYLTTLTIFLLLVVGQSIDAKQTCDQLIAQIIASISSGDISKLPIPSVMYSGITTNNPGQKYQCENTANKAKINYNYYLVDWKNSTTNLQVYTGLCVPEQCSKDDIQRALQLLPIKNSNVYDYEDSVDPLMIVCVVLVGIWVAIVAGRSIFLSFTAPMQNQYLKKHDQQRQKPINASGQAVQQLQAEQIVNKKEDFKLFNFYQGYSRIFKRNKQKNYQIPFLFFGALIIVISTQFSYRQTISANELKAMKWFNSFTGVLFCNIQIAYSLIMFILGFKLVSGLFKLQNLHQIGRFYFDQIIVKWGILFLTSMGAYFLLSLTDQPLNQIWIKNYGKDCSSTIYQMWFLFRSLQIDCKACLTWFWVLEVDLLLSIVAAPFFVIYRSNKMFGKILFAVALIISIVSGVTILQSQSILFEPYKLFNMVKQFTINYQTNPIVRVSPYFLGFIGGLFIKQSLDNEQDASQGSGKRLINRVRRSQKLQKGLHIFGAILMIAMLLLIIPYLPLAQKNQQRPSAIFYLVLAPFFFLCGLLMFILPCYWQGQSRLTVLLSRALSSNFWKSLQNMSVGFLLIGPVVIGFTTYSMQNSIYFDFQTVLVYFLGDCVIIYILTLLSTSAIDNQLHFLSNYLQAKTMGNQSKRSVVIVQQ